MLKPNTRNWLRPCLGIILCWWVASAYPSELADALNLRAEATLAQQQGTPLIVLFSRHGCHYCELVRRDYLRPMLKTNAPQNPVLVRQIHIDRNTTLIDFEGKTTTHARFSQQQKISLAPVVAFYGADGQTLAAPIVGVRIADFYQSYLDEAIASAQQRLRLPPRTP